MQTSKTDKYVYNFVYFLAFTMAINVDGLGPDYVISSVEEIQPQLVISIMDKHYRMLTHSTRLWSQIVGNFVAPQAPRMPPKDRKVVVVGLTRLLTQSVLMLQEPSVNAWLVVVPYAWPCVLTVPSGLRYSLRSLRSSKSPNTSLRKTR